MVWFYNFGKHDYSESRAVDDHFICGFYNYGKHDYSEAELDENSPLKVTDDLRLSEDGKCLALINTFAPGSLLYRLSDPRAQGNDDRNHVFYHVFLGKDAAAARQMINEFISAADLEYCSSVALLRKEPDRLFFYSNGHICTSLINKQEDLKALIPEIRNEEDDVFILPLKRFLFHCPVCGQRTLPKRGMFDICDECGWEDEGIDGDDEEPIFCPNGDYTIRQYREEYLKLKAENPDYKWSESDDLDDL